METRVQLFAVAVTLGLFLVVLELVRRRRLLERYAVLWLFSALALLALAVWKGLLGTIANAVGIFYPPSALFVIAFGFILVLLLHFSLAVSKLADQTKTLAQRVALLEQRQRSGEEVPLRAGADAAEPGVAEPGVAEPGVGRSATGAGKH
jgi:hypothetical protein